MLPLVKQNRFSREESGVYSSISLNGEAICFALENADTLIQAGTYRCTRDRTGKHQWWKLEDRHDREAIEIHIGNYDDASEGCILFGTYIYEHVADKGLMRSKDALDYFLSKLTELGYEDFDLRITESF